MEAPPSYSEASKPTAVRIVASRSRGNSPSGSPPQASQLASSSFISTASTSSWAPQPEDSADVYTFVFLHKSKDEMLVVRSNVDDAQPLYNISVELDMFFPLNWVTTVTRGGGQIGAGEVVGKLSLGLTDHQKLLFGESEISFKAAVAPYNMISEGAYVNCTLGTGNTLRWRRKIEYGNGSILDRRIHWTCHNWFVPSQPLLATYSPATKETLKDVTYPKLRVQKQALALLDELLIAVLLLERATQGKLHAE